MKSKFYKYSWGFRDDGREKYVIVQPLDSNCEEVQKIKESGIISDCALHKNCHWGKLVYGSNVKYSRTGRIFYFRDVKTITVLDTNEVMEEHFTGLL